jgi:hypothetical protein
MGAYSYYYGDPLTGILVGVGSRAVESEQRCVRTPLVDSAEAKC